MKVKIFQLNTWGGRFLPKIISFIKEHNFDVIHFQEVANGKWLKQHSSQENFETLLENLTDYTGILVPCRRFTADSNSYFGNATFFRNKFTLQKHTIIWLKDYAEVTDLKEEKLEDQPRSALDVQLKVSDSVLHFINCHLAWGSRPDDKDYKLIQAKKIIDYVDSLKFPFVITGDYNVIPQTKLVKMFDDIAINHTTENHITNTLNPKWSYPHLFPPGLAVDYIFTSPDIQTEQFKVINTPDLSDHYGLTLEFQI